MATKKELERKIKSLKKQRMSIDADLQSYAQQLQEIVAAERRAVIDACDHAGAHSTFERQFVGRGFQDLAYMICPKCGHKWGHHVDNVVLDSLANR